MAHRMEPRCRRTPSSVSVGDRLAPLEFHAARHASDTLALHGQGENTPSRFLADRANRSELRSAAPWAAPVLCRLRELLFHQTPPRSVSVLPLVASGGCRFRPGLTAPTLPQCRGHVLQPHVPAHPPSS